WVCRRLQSLPHRSENAMTELQEAPTASRRQAWRLILLGLLLPGMLNAGSSGTAAAQSPAADAATWEIQPPVEWVIPPEGDSAGRSEAERLVQIALVQHPALAAAEAEIEREAGQRYQSTRKPNPSVGYVASEMGNEGRAGQQGLYLSQEW